MKQYFIWEKSYWNNKGISINVSLSPYCYIKPTMSKVWHDFDRREYSNEKYKHYLVCIEKTIFWLWFRVNIKVEITRAGL